MEIWTVTGRDQSRTLANNSAVAPNRVDGLGRLDSLGRIGDEARCVIMAVGTHRCTQREVALPVANTSILEEKEMCVDGVNV